MKILDIDGPEIAVAFFIFLWLQNAELGLPETKQGLVDPEHFRNLPHGIVLLAEKLLILRYADQVGLFRDLADGFSAPPR
jgi:hypothetical protein